MKTLDTEGMCISSKHYMVDLFERVREIKGLVDAGRFFKVLYGGGAT